MMNVENVYTSIACNRTTGVADWGNNGLIVFGASNAVAILDPNLGEKSAKILHTYVQHTKKVKAVQWLRETADSIEKYIISGSDDGLGIVWDIGTRAEQPVAYALQGHSSGLEAVTGMKHPKGYWLLGTSAADSTVRLWQFDGAKCKCLQTIVLNTGFCFSLRFTQLPKAEEVLLAFSTDDEIISLWIEHERQQQQSTEATPETETNDDGGAQFRLVHKLSGHEDWVTGLDFIHDDNGKGDGGSDLLLASASQDNFIRLWRISQRSEAQVRENAVDIFNVMDDTVGEIRVEEKILQLATNGWYAISLESVLCGHEGWVHSVQWHKSVDQGLRLLSASIDKTIIVWEPADDGVWMEKVRVGEVGGNSLGFFGARFSSDGKSILGFSFHGGFHIWQQEANNIWSPRVIVGGHFSEVRDLAWEPTGAYLMTVSADQTTRIHAPWHGADTWHEIARPQVHGYDMQALAVLTRYKFASGAEEKIVRTFQAPANFVENFRRITDLQADTEGDALLESLPKGASVPSLGLSNKAVYSVDATSPSTREIVHVKDEYPENYFVPIALDTPPQEETLMQNTLWPETQKLYGHGFEIYALAPSPDGQLVASTCRATNAEHAQILLWNANTWKQMQRLSAHQLTVTQMRFSPDGQYLLSVSRDRRWALFERTAGSGEFALLATTDKSNGIHARIIWTCDWSHDGKYFATASRDGKVAVWTRPTTANSAADTSSLNGWLAVHVLELKNVSITALAFACKFSKDEDDAASGGAYLLALGCESGLIQIYRFAGACHLLTTLDHNQAHHSAVKRLQFRPQCTDLNNHQLASCGDDCLVRIYELNMI